MSFEETAALCQSGIIIPDPWSVLISSSIAIGKGTILWPGTVLRCLQSGQITIGEEADIGSEGGFTITAQADDVITIGNHVRLLGGGSLSDKNKIGDGAQILGPIRCQRCFLASGGSHQTADPDQRGAVLKGSGVARDLTLHQGQVIQAFGLFSKAPIHMQSFFHPQG